MKQQITDTVLMVRPVNFRMNEQTAVNNYYQKVLKELTPQTLQERALKEFDAFVEKLRQASIRVVVVQDSENPDTPDSIFPNNWISFHDNSTIALYPMFAENRRLERREEVLNAVEKEGFPILEVVDYTEAEEDGIFLEGTGSMILDRVNRKAYCALSPRADEELFIEFCEDFEYSPVIFTAWQTVNGERKQIYHTNVMMSVGEDFAIVCTAAIDDRKERKQLLSQLREDGKEIIEISEEQVNSFAGNMLQLRGENGKKYLVMSEAARRSLDKSQVEKIEGHCEILSAPLDVIEACGGGSARCMMAEIFLSKGQG
ncbi:citrulline utilization hydrolase CtlX [Sinomicrobium sp.]